MTKITFEDLPSTNTPLNANNLNTLQDNVEDAINNITIELDDTVSTSSTNGVENQAITNYVNNEISDTKDYVDTKVQEVYSTTEQRVGTWIDGKPLYKRVIEDTLGTTSGTWKDIQAFSANYIKYIVSAQGAICTSNGNYYPLPLTRITDNSYSNREYVYYNISPSAGYVSIIAASGYYAGFSGRPFYLIVLYTKTSDYS